MDKTYYAHKSEEGRFQTMLEHATGTAKRASENAAAFGCAEIGRIAGKYHDTGKYGDGFQARLYGSGEPYEHSAAGMRLFLDAMQKTNARA